MSGIHFVDARTPSLLSISTTTRWFAASAWSTCLVQPVGRLAKRKSNDLSAAPAAHPSKFSAPPAKENISF